MVKIALVSCGTEYSGIQKEIEKAANTFGAEIILPEIDLDYIDFIGVPECRGKTFPESYL